MTDPKPEKIGDIFEASVRDIASDGRGVVSHGSGRTYFVAGVWRDEKVKVRITGMKARIGFAELLEIIEPSEHRVAPPCGHHGMATGQCGGCPWQFISYPEQLAEKQRKVHERFSRLGVSAEVRDIWPSQNSFGFRNRAQFKSDGRIIGYVSGQSNTLAPIDDCLVLSEKNRSTLAELKTHLPNPQWKGTKKKPWTSLDIDENTTAEHVSVNQRLPFQQGNSAQNIQMKNWLAEKLSTLPAGLEALELFCGSGNFTEVLASAAFTKITAVEAVDEALKALNAHKWDNVETLCANLFQEQGMNTALFKAKNAEILVLDPPREGLKEIGNLFVKKSKIRQVFYISCDSATLVRDLAIFQQHKFKVKEVQPLDQFPHTPHVEFLVHLKK